MNASSEDAEQVRGDLEALTEHLQREGWKLKWSTDSEAGLERPTIRRVPVLLALITFWWWPNLIWTLYLHSRGRTVERMHLWIEDGIGEEEREWQRPEDVDEDGRWDFRGWEE